MIKNVLSREHICPESNSHNGQCLLQVICKTLGVVSLFSDVGEGGREGGKKWGEEVLGEVFQKLLPVVLLYSHLSLKWNPKELIPKQRSILNALETSTILYACVHAFKLMYVCIQCN